jgi:hypothetical protein
MFRFGDCCTDEAENEFDEALYGIPLGDFKILTNNCCSWARRAVEGGGWRWNVPTLNCGFNPGDTCYDRCDKQYPKRTRSGHSSRLLSQRNAACKRRCRESGDMPVCTACE